MLAELPDHLDLLYKAALVAHNVDAFEDLDELEDSDKETLRHEAEHKWHLARHLWYTIAVCSIGAAVHGWDQTGSNGANLSFPAEFGIAGETACDKWLVGLINSAPTIATLSDPLNNATGRRGTIFVAAVFSFCSVLGAAFTQTWPQLLVCRLLLGIGMGVKQSTTAVFAAECSPAAIRGALTMTWQLWLAFGIFLGFSANIAVINAGAITWRLQLGSALIPAVPLLFSIYFCPESPRWLMKKGRYAAAHQSLLKLRTAPLLAARELYSIHVEFEQDQVNDTNKESTLKRFTQLFTIPRIRRANHAAGIVMLAQQMCGINIISFYSSTIFAEAGVSHKSALWASWGFGLVNFLFAFPALRTIDTFRRRSLLLFTFPHMAWSLLAAGLCYLIPAPGQGPVCYPYAAEVYPISHRELGMAWSVAINALGSSILSLTFPYLLQTFTTPGAFGFYAGLNVLAFVMIFLWVPETKRLTLEELDSVFEVPTALFTRYQLSVALPYWVQRWVFWRRSATLAPSYWDGSV
ncbi:general substrate transporter [Aspergillus granulosus]|uniref:General substrate transporter n=1 Tax=Aspergillus granulosus TaxID=176169 RepID=A0ABR4H581_9EURO